MSNKHIQAAFLMLDRGPTAGKRQCLGKRYHEENTKYKVQNTKYKTQNTKHKVQNTKYKIQNTKYKVPNTRTKQKNRMKYKKIATESLSCRWQRLKTAVSVRYCAATQNSARQQLKKFIVKHNLMMMSINTEQPKKIMTF